MDKVPVEVVGVYQVLQVVDVKEEVEVEKEEVEEEEERVEVGEEVAVDGEAKEQHYLLVLHL